MTQCISRRRGSDLRPSIMRPVCFLQPARVRHVYCVSPYPPKPCQALPPPMGSPAAHWLVGVYSNSMKRTMYIQSIYYGGLHVAHLFPTI